MVQKQGNRYITSVICNENHEWIVATADSTFTQERLRDELAQELLHDLAHMETSCLAIAHMDYTHAADEIRAMLRPAIKSITIIYI